ncbi:hypothetical protein JCGZ_12377 [Jatropha curcas]|uniref:Uncharacterized protein n=1 Tax=Jatropha curcas TaxID=180498 RepID=A0A067K6Q0_JATCU|nr:uncharacterized membrane protein At3g27390 isoform X2 [Jatropha curcas]KDP31916.1 hypothetical protein JCGZ_12377 [Jatropha curcas]
MAMSNNVHGCLRIIYVVIAFCSAFFFGGLKALLVGPIAASILIVGNVGVILLMFPLHVAWTVYTVVKTNRFDALLKVALLLTLPVLFSIWLGLSIAVTALVGLGYGFFTPWVSTFEAFRQETESKKFYHCLVDGTLGPIKGSCTVVRDFADMCYHSYLLYLKELRDSPASNEQRPLRLIHIPGFIIAGLMGLIVDVPLFTAIAVIKSPYMLFKGWFRLIHDLVSREGPFLETACIPVAGLTILFWPLIVVGSILLSIFSSIFIGLYASVIVYQERSFRKGVAYVIAMVAEFDEYTNDGLYLREGTFLPKPRYRKKKASNSSELSVGGNLGKFGSISGTEASAAMFMPSLAPSRSVRETIQEVKMVQVWGHVMRSCEIRGKELVDVGAITLTDLNDCLKAKNANEGVIVGVGLPCYSLLHTLLFSIKAASHGFLLVDGVEVTHLNRPNDRLFEWFFHPLLVVKEQIRVIKLEEGEERFLQKVILFGNDTQRMEAWDNGSIIPQEALRAAQIQGLSRRMLGMVRSASKLPTYRRRFRQVVKALIAYSTDKESDVRSNSVKSVGSTKEGGVRSSSVRSVGSTKEGGVRSSSIRSIASTDLAV